MLGRALALIEALRMVALVNVFDIGEAIVLGLLLLLIRWKRILEFLEEDMSSSRRREGGREGGNTWKCESES